MEIEFGLEIVIKCLRSWVMGAQKRLLHEACWCWTTL